MTFFDITTLHGSNNIVDENHGGGEAGPLKEA
jgi:hypothetical protein